MLPPDDVPGPLGAPPPVPSFDLAGRAYTLLEERPRWAVVAAAGALVLLAVVVLLAGLAGGSEPPLEDSLPLAGAVDGGGGGAGPAAAGGGPSSTTTSAPTELVVHAAGAVSSPGLYRLPAGARVDDLVAAAGGLADNADADRVNLALPLVDGERVYVPAVGQEAVPEAPGPSGPVPGEGGAAAGPDAGPVNINTATLAELETLPGVGPVTAQTIVEYREQEGAFASVDDLLAVQGIGEAKLAALRDQVTV